MICLLFDIYKNTASCYHSISCDNVEGDSGWQKAFMTFSTQSQLVPQNHCIKCYFAKWFYQQFHWEKRKNLSCGKSNRCVASVFNANIIINPLVVYFAVISLVRLNFSISMTILMICKRYWDDVVNENGSDVLLFWKTVFPNARRTARLA